MRTTKPLLLAIALLTGCSGGTSVAPSTLSLTVIGTNDLHGALLGRAGNGGLSVFGGYMDNLRIERDQSGAKVLLIDAGDMWQGTLESNLAEGAPVVAAYNELGYAAAAIGNHEFDFGPLGPRATPVDTTDDARGALKQRAVEAEFPFLSANLIDSVSGRPVEWENVRPSTILDIDGLKVGIIGVITIRALQTTIASNVRGLQVAPLAETIAAEAQRMRLAGVSLVIVSAHAGGDCSEFGDSKDLSSCQIDREIFQVARDLPKGLVDIMIGGHQHRGIAHEVNGIAIMTSYSSGRYFGRVDLDIDRQDGSVLSRRLHAPHPICEFVDGPTRECRANGARAIYAGKPVMPSREIERILAPAVSRAASMKSETLGPILDTPIRRGRNPESEIGNMMTDILLVSVPGADVSIHNTLGGIRADLPAGPLTYGDVYEMFPFDNRLTLLHLNGAELKAILANQLQGPTRRGHIAGVRVTAGCKAGAFHMTVTDVDGAPIADDDDLLVATNDFLAIGGDNIFTPVMPAGGFATDDSAPLVRELVAAWMRQRGGHISGSDFFDGTPRRWKVDEPLPIVCVR